MVVVVGQRQLDIHIREQLRVALGDRPPRLEDPVELLELADPERRRDVVEAIVVTEPPVLEPARRLEPPLVAQRDEQLVLLRRPGRHRPALAGRDLLVRVEREDRRVAVRAERTALVERPERLARILNERQTVLVTDRPQLVDLARIPVDVDRDDRLRAWVTAASTAAGSRFSVCGSMSANTGVPPSYIAQFAEATNEYGDVITSSPGPTPASLMQR